MILFSRRGCGLGLLLLSLLAGCSQMNLNNVVKEPRVQVQNIAVREVNLDSVGLDLVMQVTNPNAYTLALAGYDYRIRFNDHQLVEGSTDEGFRVAANASNQIRVPFKVGFKDVMKLLDSMGDSNTLHYEVDADMRLDAPVLNLFNIKSHKKGDITIPQLPRVSFGDLKVKSFNFTEASFELAMQITNPNQFGLDLKDLDYQFSVGGEKWFDGRIDQTVKIGEKQTTTVKIPVSVSLLKLGSGAFSAIQKGNFTDYSLDANFTLDSTYPALKNLQIPLHYKP
ncbi:MAG: LEA type 2 family protein [Pseudomonadota bacterium]|nr:LEA type 2 family protein [Pseudomonadota bacterium]